MRITITAVITALVLLQTQARLVEKSTSPAPESHVVNSTHRHRRQLDEEDVIYSKEENLDIIYDSPVKKNSNHKFLQRQNPGPAKIRDSRETNSNKKRNSTKPNTTSSATVDKKVLIKKPIPKYTEKDYSDDFHSNVVLGYDKKTADSMEHEDEDFNVDDYEFDVNHDEFAGRGKPLEPRLKPEKETKQQHSSFNEKSHQKSNSGRTETRVQRESVYEKESATEKVISSSTLTSSTPKEEYEDDVQISSPSPKKQRHAPDEDFYDNDQSKEAAVIRNVRSPWLRQYKGDLGEKVFDISSFMTALPMFPQVPANTNINSPRQQDEMDLRGRVFLA